MTNDLSLRPLCGVFGVLLLVSACEDDIAFDEHDATAHGSDAAAHSGKDATLDSAQGLDDAAEPPSVDADSAADARMEDAGTDSSAPQGTGATPACSARTLASFEAGKEQAKCAAYPNELAQGGDLKLYCSCDLAACPVIAEPPADGAPDKACATMVVGKNCAEALQSTCGLKPGDNDFCAENHGTGRDLCTKRTGGSYECTCVGSSEKQAAEHEFCLDALRAACRRGS